MISTLTESTTLYFVDVETTGVRLIDHCIEVGLVAVDGRFDELERWSTLVCPQALMIDAVFSEPGARPVHWSEQPQWWPSAQGAFAVHQIPLAAVLGGGVTEMGVVQRLRHTLERCPQRDERYKGPILVSDNIAFEVHHLRKLLPDGWWPFHYAAWDTSLLLELTGVGDPPSDEVKHRALDDALGLVERVRQAATLLAEAGGAS